MSNADGNAFLPVLRRLAEIDPDRSALTCGDATLTRAGFVERVERLAAKVLADERTRTIKAQLSHDQELIYPPLQKFWDDALKGGS